MEKNTYRILKKIFLITLGSLSYAIGIAIFLDPNSLAPGGVTGIAIILSKLTGIRTGTLALMINIPLLFFGLYKFGFRFLLSTIYVTFVSSFFINMISTHFVDVYGVLTKDLLLSGAAGGALMSLGMALVFRNGATTGGTDIIVRAIRQRYKHIKTGTIFLVTDCIIITASAIIFRNIEVAMYAAITVVISNTVLDKVLYGGDSAQLLYIISENHDIIAKKIMDELEIGVTYLKAEGAYTSDGKNVIMCVCRNYNYSKIREFVKNIDQDAFFIVAKANDVFGDGYKSHTVEEI